MLLGVRLGWGPGLQGGLFPSNTHPPDARTLAERAGTMCCSSFPKQKVPTDHRMSFQFRPNSFQLYVRQECTGYFSSN